MQISKIAVFACACVLLAVAARADQDNPDQAAARAALVAKLFDASAVTTATNATAPTASAPAVAAPAVTAPTAASPAVSATTVVKPAAKTEAPVMHPVNQPAAAEPAPRIDTTGNFRLYRSPHLEIQNPDMNGTKAYDSAPKAKAPAAQPAPKAVAAAPAANSSQPAGQPAKPAAISATPKPATTKTAAPATATTAKPAPQFAPINVPDSPLPPAKQQRLQELLAKYKADQITPEEYHKQRAAILSGM